MLVRVVHEPVAYSAMRVPRSRLSLQRVAGFWMKSFSAFELLTALHRLLNTRFCVAITL